MAVSTTRDKAITIRATREQCDLIDQAASMQGKTRSDFMLETACRAAEQSMLDRVVFQLGTESFDQFVAILDDPAAPSPELRALLAKRPPWE